MNQKNQIICNDNNLEIEDQNTTKKPQPHRNKKNGGFTLFEVVIVIGIVVVAIAGYLGLSGPVLTTVRTNSLNSELATLQQKIHEVYNGQQNGYSGISAQELITSKAYPGSLNATANSLTNNFAGKVTISSDDGSGTSFSIAYAGVPSGVCSNLISQLTTSGSGWEDISVGGSSIWSGTSSVPSKSKVDSACQASAKVAMKFTSN